MRVVQISDLHLTGDGAPAYGVVDTWAALEACVAHLLDLSPLPDAVVVTGDVADRGEATAYARARGVFAALTGAGVPVHFTPGNHDHGGRLRAALGALCPHDPDAPEGAGYCVEMDGARLVCLDTRRPGSHAGCVSPSTAAWLGRMLDRRPGVPALVFAHHPPFASGLGVMDAGRMDGRALAGVLAGRDGVQLCFGHLHRALFTRWAGCPAVVCPSTAMQLEPRFASFGGGGFVLETPGYLLHLCGADADPCGSGTEAEGSHHPWPWVTHVCQIPWPGMAGPYPFAGAVNPEG